MVAFSLVDGDAQLLGQRRDVLGHVGRAGTRAAADRGKRTVIGRPSSALYMPSKSRLLHTAAAWQAPRGAARRSWRRSSRAWRRYGRRRRTCARCGTGRCPPRRTSQPAAASCGLSALVRTLSLRAASAQPMTAVRNRRRWKRRRSGSPRRTPCRWSRRWQIQSPSWNTVLPPMVDGLGFLVIVQLAAAGDAAGAHAAGNNGRVRGHAAADGQDALRRRHALDVFRRGLQTNQNDLLARLGRSCVASSAVKYDLPQAAPGEAARPMADRASRPSAPRRQTAGAAGSPAASAPPCRTASSLGDHAFVDQVDGDLQRGGRGALAVTGLEHVELAVLDGELHILHVAVVVLQRMRDVLRTARTLRA